MLGGFLEDFRCQVFDVVFVLVLLLGLYSGYKAGGFGGGAEEVRA